MVTARAEALKAEGATMSKARSGSEVPVTTQKPVASYPVSETIQVAEPSGVVTSANPNLVAAANSISRLVAFAAIAFSALVIWLIILGLRMIGAPAVVVLTLAFVSHLILFTESFRFVSDLVLELNNSVHEVLNSRWVRPGMLVVASVLAVVAAVVAVKPF